MDTAYRILPNVPTDSFTGPNISSTNASDTCSISIYAATSSSSSMIGPILGGLIGAILVFLAFIILLVWKYYPKYRTELSALPEDVRWYYEQYYDKPGNWQRNELGGVFFYSKQIREGMEAWTRMLNFVYEYGQATGINVKEAYLVYNPELVSAFITQMKIVQSRMESDPLLFSNQNFNTTRDRTSKEWVMKKYRERYNYFPWNTSTMTPTIIPAVHGTGREVAWKICSTGFASLSSLDAGFYGKGIYFTTYMLYALQYFAGKKDPAVILSFILPGNCYPTTEHPHKPHNLLGSPLKNGFNSHYVVTDISGMPAHPANGEDTFDEIVVNQEAQVMPAIVILLETKNLCKLQQSLADRLERKNSAMSLTESSQVALDAQSTDF